MPLKTLNKCDRFFPTSMISHDRAPVNTPVKLAIALPLHPIENWKMEKVSGQENIP